MFGLNDRFLGVGRFYVNSSRWWPFALMLLGHTSPYLNAVGRSSQMLGLNAKGTIG